jgi:electron transport complex protein RnfB
MSPNAEVSRRDALRTAVRGAGLIALGGALATLIGREARGETVWQIDPFKCVQCGKCATNCVLKTSAVKCVHAYGLCGYCDLCTGFFHADPNALNTGAENQLCPTDALKRRYVEDPYYEYSIDADLCIGCGKCVKGCTIFGNGSLMLQIDQHECVHCNWCAIAANCPAQAIEQVPADKPYLIKTKTRTG